MLGNIGSSVMQAAQSQFHGAAAAHAQTASNPSASPADLLAGAAEAQAAKNTFILGASILKTEQEMFDALMDALDSPGDRGGHLLDVTV